MQVVLEIEMFLRLFVLLHAWVHLQVGSWRHWWPQGCHRLSQQSVIGYSSQHPNKKNYYCPRNFENIRPQLEQNESLIGETHPKLPIAENASNYGKKYGYNTGVVGIRKEKAVSSSEVIRVTQPLT